ncbi:peptidase C14, caspase domain-containing protein [Trichoderma pleuroticola]
MTTSNHRKWAILVDINYYGYPKDEQLDGSVNDIHKISTFLQNVIQIPAANILMYHDFNEDDETDEDTQLRRLPTRANVLQALKRVSKDAAKGNFVYFHYSGHGDRKDTQYIHLKGSTTTFDEVFCTLDGEIRDVEFGDILDDMVSKQLVVLAVLDFDCCHSGGATRAGFKDQDGNLVKLRQPPNRNRSYISGHIRNDLIYP